MSTVRFDQSRREGGVGGSKLPRARDIWGPVVAQKYKVHCSAPF